MANSNGQNNDGRMLVDRRSVEYVAGDSALLAMLRAGIYPTGGGCLCLAGDCSHCVATVDGVSYTRTILTKALASRWSL
jgi:aerobic-type carbon monoxide dehydrogenase small subunit (CoxS/CutS family)